MRDDKAVEILAEMFTHAFMPESNRERALVKLHEDYKDRVVKVVLDMANRYDEDIEGCDGDELVGYTEAISCCYRLAFVLKHGRLPKKDDKRLTQDLIDEGRKLYKEPLKWRT